MTDTTTVPFQPGTLASAPEAPELEESSGNNRLLLILGAAAGLAVLAIAAYFLLFAGSDDKEAAAAAVPKTVAQPATAPTTAPTTTAALPKISARNFGTDPFKPLLVDDTATTAVPTGTTTPIVTTPTTTPSIPPTTPTTPTTPAGPAYKFKVINVANNNESAKVSLNGDVSTINPGDTVGDKFLAKRFQGGTCGTFKFGHAPAFDLCEGSTVKR